MEHRRDHCSIGPSQPQFKRATYYDYSLRFVCFWQRQVQATSKLSACCETDTCVVYTKLYAPTQFLHALSHNVVCLCLVVLGNSSFSDGLPLKLCIIRKPKIGDNLITEMDNGPKLFTDLCKILHSETI